jgi:hypothetical protein
VEYIRFLLVWRMVNCDRVILWREDDVFVARLWGYVTCRQHSVSEMAEQHRYLRRRRHLNNTTNTTSDTSTFLSADMHYVTLTVLCYPRIHPPCKVHPPRHPPGPSLQGSAPKVHHMYRNTYIMVESARNLPGNPYRVWCFPDAAVCDMKQKYVRMEVVCAEAICAQPSYSVL